MAGLSTNAPGLWGGFAGLLYGSTSLSTPPGFLADAPPAWVPDGGVLAFEFDNGLGYNSRNLATTTPDSILTYTSPSPKLVYGSDGVLRYAPHNLLTFSEQFNDAAWGKAQATVTANAAAAPDGTTTADALLDTAVSDLHRVTQSFTGAAAGRTYTVSAYLKASTLNYATIGITDISSGSLYAVAVFNLAAGTVSTSGAEGTGYSVVFSAMTSVGNGWYRCVVTATAGASASFLRAVVSTNKTGVITSASGGSEVYLGNGSGVFVWGAQLSQGVTLFTYIPTTTAAVYSLPIDHNPTTFEPLGVLIEEQRTNLLTYSAQFDNAAWTRGNIAAFGSGSIANAIVAPDGTTTADKIVEAATTATHNIAQNATIVTATVYTYSVHAKAAERSWLCLEGGGGGGGFSVWFNLATGAVGTISGTTAGNVSIVALPNGWYRCIVTDTSTSTSGTYRYFICDADNNQLYAGDGTSGLYLWGAQLE